MGLLWRVHNRMHKLGCRRRTSENNVKVVNNPTSIRIDTPIGLYSTTFDSPCICICIYRCNLPPTARRAPTRPCSPVELHGAVGQPAQQPRSITAPHCIASHPASNVATSSKLSFPHTPYFRIERLLKDKAKVRTMALKVRSRLHGVSGYLRPTRRYRTWCYQHALSLHTMQRR
ncbi:hypothetical protein K491DRAFT_387925 [Lophiostoma macrostomum CBS 122681]|uniref:Uncharacterized protein n=1 Tax=Lophiostoma macrostomum CBS 122681 TaxID=1314788 RepID=A0A6A6TSF3_9PLEO|nr:hypothetical protein K491DRAFT_387925 [Lophiostoma macrostomum CBS 122681]